MRNNGASDTAPVRRSRSFPDRGLFDFESHKQREERRQPADEEHRSPSPFGKNKEVAARRQQVSDRVTLLQDSGENTSPFRRHFLHHERRADAPLAAHADAEQGPQDEECFVIGRQPGKDFHHGIKHEIQHQRKPSPVAVGQQSEDERADRPERECYRDGLRDFRQIHVELLRDGRNREDEDEEVKGIESPAQETRDQGVEVVFALFVAGGRHALESNGIDSPPTLIHPSHARRTL